MLDLVVNLFILFYSVYLLIQSYIALKKDDKDTVEINLFILALFPIILSLLNIFLN